MREITAHKIGGLNEAVSIEVEDEPGPGGTHHLYSIWWSSDNGRQAGETWLRFQNGPIKEVGPNGITHESLLAVVIDRLQAFQAGPFACRENADALYHAEQAMHSLHSRTRERAARGVEGTHVE